MFDSTRFLLFLTAAVLLAIAPGPGMLYVLGRSRGGGKREGVLSALGTFLGGMVHVFAAALVVSVVLAKSAVAFAMVKYVGAALRGSRAVASTPRRVKNKRLGLPGIVWASALAACLNTSCARPLSFS